MSVAAITEPTAAIQDAAEPGNCFGCGPSNEQGLQLKSYWDGRAATGIFQPEAHHSAGPPHVLYGGIVASLIDCHSVCTAVAAACEAAAIPVDQPSVARPWYVTGSLHVEYLRPTPIDRPVLLSARVVESSEKRSLVECSLSSDGEECARGSVVAVRVEPDWLQQDHS